MPSPPNSVSGARAAADEVRAAAGGGEHLGDPRRGAGRQVELGTQSRRFPVATTSFPAGRPDRREQSSASCAPTRKQGAWALSGTSVPFSRISTAPSGASLHHDGVLHAGVIRVLGVDRADGDLHAALRHARLRHGGGRGADHQQGDGEPERPRRRAMPSRGRCWPGSTPPEAPVAACAAGRRAARARTRRAPRGGAPRWRGAGRSPRRSARRTLVGQGDAQGCRAGRPGRGRRVISAARSSRSSRFVVPLEVIIRPFANSEGRSS